MSVVNPGGGSSPNFAGKTLIADKLQLNVAAADTLNFPNGGGIGDGANFAFTIDHNGLQVGGTTASVIHNANGGNEAAAATAGAAVLPANPVGFFIFRDTAGNVRKVPYYAN